MRYLARSFALVALLAAGVIAGGCSANSKVGVEAGGGCALPDPFSAVSDVIHGKPVPEVKKPSEDPAFQKDVQDLVKAQVSAQERLAALEAKASSPQATAGEKAAYQAATDAMAKADEASRVAREATQKAEDLATKAAEAKKHQEEVPKPGLPTEWTWGGILTAGLGLATWLGRRAAASRAAEAAQDAKDAAVKAVKAAHDAYEALPADASAGDVTVAVAKAAEKAVEG